MEECLAHLPERSNRVHPMYRDHLAHNKVSVIHNSGKEITLDPPLWEMKNETLSSLKHTYSIVIVAAIAATIRVNYSKLMSRS